MCIFVQKGLVENRWREDVERYEVERMCCVLDDIYVGVSWATSKMGHT